MTGTVLRLYMKTCVRHMETLSIIYQFTYCTTYLVLIWMLLSVIELLKFASINGMKIVTNLFSCPSQISHVMVGYPPCYPC